MYQRPYVYSEHPTVFQADADINKASALTGALASLSGGYYPELTKELTQNLIQIFDEVKPDKDGHKKLGSLIYYSNGFVFDKSTKNTVIMPPIQQTDIIIDEQKDMKMRVKRINQLIKYIFRWSVFQKNQFRYYLDGKKPDGNRTGIIGKSLFKITKLVEALEAAEIKDIDILRPIIHKLNLELERCPHLTSYIQIYNFKHADIEAQITHRVYGIKYFTGEKLKDAAEQLKHGPIERERIYGITKRINDGTNIHCKWFVPLSERYIGSSWTDYVQKELKSAGYYEEILQCLADNGVPTKGICKKQTVLPYYRKLKDPEERKKHMYESTIDIRQSVINYADALADAKIHALMTIYDAMQVYDIYASIEDETVHDFLINYGYLIKDWTPDPQLYLRVANAIPAQYGNQKISNGVYEEEINITKQAHKEAAAIAEKYTSEMFNKFSGNIPGTERFQKELDKIKNQILY